MHMGLNQICQIEDCLQSWGRPLSVSETITSQCCEWLLYWKIPSSNRLLGNSRTLEGGSDWRKYIIQAISFRAVSCLASSCYSSELLTSHNMRCFFLLPVHPEIKELLSNTPCYHSVLPKCTGAETNSSTFKLFVSGIGHKDEKKLIESWYV